MKILVYGAGVLGSLYAARLKDSGHEVSILARGQRLADIREHGIVLENAKTGERTTTGVDAVERLDPEDAYDLVMVVMSRNQALGVLDALAENRNTPNVMFMCNTAAGPEAFVNALGPERVLLGFAGAGGAREGHVVTYVMADEQPTTIGELDGRNTDRIRRIYAAIKGAGFKAEICNNMDAWLKTHVAEISPTAMALYLAEGDNYRLARTRDGLTLLVRAIREGYAVLSALEIPITPGKHKVFKWLPEPLLIWVMKKMLNDKMVEYKAVRHAGAAREEMKQIADEFRELARKTGVETPALNRLYACFDPSTELIPDGSAELPVRWRSVGWGLSAAAALVAAGLLVLL
jgi:2-dehydropantoate 2-reductase